MALADPYARIESGPDMRATVFAPPRSFPAWPVVRKYLVTAGIVVFMLAVAMLLIGAAYRGRNG